MGGTTTGIGVFLVTNTVLVKADPVDGAGDSDALGAAVLATSGLRVDSETNDALGEKESVTIVRAG